MTNYPIAPDNPAHLGFPPSLPTELAMGLNSVSDICTTYGMAKADLAKLVDNPMFAAEYKAAMEIRGKDGGLFTLKARLMSEDALEEQYKLMKDKDAPHAVRLKASENLIAAADRMPRKSAEGAMGDKFHLSINFTAQHPQSSFQINSPAINTSSNTIEHE